jgi:hypothetical protein
MLISIDGNENHDEKSKPTNVELLYDYPLLGRTEITGPARKREVIAAIKEAIKHPGRLAGCFFPRHVLRIENENEIIDLVICFECGSYQVHRNKIERAEGGRVGTSAEKLFNEILTEAGIPLAPRLDNGIALAEGHFQVLRRAFAMDARFANVKPEHFNGDLAIMGTLDSEDTMAALKRVVDVTNPPVRVIYRVTFPRQSDR